MAKFTFVVALLSCFAIVNINCVYDDIDCTKVFTCDVLKPGHFNSRGNELACNPVGSATQDKICNFFPIKTCPPCVLKVDLCNKYYTCDPADLSIVKIEDLVIECPETYECNNRGNDHGCPPCVRQICSTPKDWECISESQAERNGQIIECAPTTVCNANNVAPCNTPCVQRNPIADNYISMLRSLSKSVRK